MAQSFRKSLSFEDRFAKASGLIKKYPGYIPIICEKNQDSNGADLEKKKYMVPGEITLGQFLTIVRKRIKLEQSQAIFIFVNGHIISSHEIISSVYQAHKDHDNFLYMTYSKENTFG